MKQVSKDLYTIMILKTMLMFLKVGIQNLKIHIISIKLCLLAHFHNIKIMILLKKKYQAKRNLINIAINLFKM